MKTKFLFSFFFIFLFLLISLNFVSPATQYAFAVSNLTNGQQIDITAGANVHFYQTFKVGWIWDDTSDLEFYNNSFYLTSLALQMKKSSTPDGYFRVCVAEVNATGWPLNDNETGITEYLLGCSDEGWIYSDTYLTTDWDNYLFTFPFQDILLEEDETYAIVVERSGGTSGGVFLSLAMGGNDGYYSGSAYYSGQYTSVWKYAYDMIFWTNGIVESQYEPFESVVNVTLRYNESYEIDWDTEFPTNFEISNFSYDYIWVADNNGCDGWNDPGQYTLLTYPLNEYNLRDTCGWGYIWTDPQDTITFYAGYYDADFSVKFYGCNVDDENPGNYWCMQKTYNFQVVSEGGSSEIGIGALDTVTGGFSGLYPRAENLSVRDRYAYVVITILIASVLIFCAVGLFFKNPSAAVWILLVVDLLLFFYFLSIGYIHVSVLVVLILILIAISYFKIRGS